MPSNATAAPSRPDAKAGDVAALSRASSSTTTLPRAAFGADASELPASTNARAAVGARGTADADPSTLAKAHDADAFDVCHGALAWRALLVVNASLVLAVFAAHAGPLDALAVAGPIGLAGLVGTTAWLAGVCIARSALVAATLSMRRLALVAWGAAIGAVCAWGWGWATFETLRPWKAWIASLIGAGFAACLAAWIEQRSRGVRPAHANARLAELQARIRPHFLFNTLNTATALVRVDPAGAETMLEDLSDLFRAALAEARTTTLGEEIAVARQYLAIEQRRFGERMRIDFDLDAAADRAIVPSLLLQPLVENAVHHGVESLRDGAWIRVRTRAARDAVTVEIENNVGTDTRRGSGMALANVRERLRLLHDLDGRFDARLDGDRFVVRLGVPLTRP